MAIFGVVAALLSACKPDSGVFLQPAQTPDRVLQVVGDHMTAKGTVMANYELESLQYDYVDRRWSVLYTGRSLAIGDHFLVLVSDQDLSKLEVVPGL